MSESQNKHLALLTVMVAVLLIAVVSQSALLFKLHNQIQSPVSLPQTAQSSCKLLTSPQTSARQTPVQMPRQIEPPLDNDLFDWGSDTWDPFKEMQAMHDQINRMFGSAYSHFQSSDDYSNLLDEMTYAPALNIQDNGDRYEITVDIPGVEDSQVHVNIEGQQLTISGSMKTQTTKQEKGKMLHEERSSGQFMRTILLPSPVQADKMTTKTAKGVLHVSIPKAQK